MTRFPITFCTGMLAAICAVQVAVAGAAKESVVYSFCGQQSCADGYGPQAGLTSVGGALYGTASAGGAYDGGVVFSIDPTDGADTVVHSFGNGTDGEGPVADLIDVKGTLYGTTSGGGGAIVFGTVFAIDPATGAETVVYSFCSQSDCWDGSFPEAGLVDVKGALYGTTSEGGAYDGGTVFSINPTDGTETVLHSFGNGTDGEYPVASLIDVNGRLYGTTSQGGTTGEGTVFSIDPATETESIVHSFGGLTVRDGSNPLAGLVNAKGTLYGTTSTGGNRHGSGTVFSIDPATGAEAILYRFRRNGDGEDPIAGLIEVKGKLYGTTSEGGTTGNGIVFSIDPAEKKDRLLYSFGGNPDGAYPAASLVNLKGAFYGTTYSGGSNYLGTLFKLNP